MVARFRGDTRLLLGPGSPWRNFGCTRAALHPVPFVAPGQPDAAPLSVRRPVTPWAAGRCAKVGIPLLGLLLLTACGNAGRTLTVVSYNVQNLYDAIHDGGEYREFTGAGGWDEALYTAKLRAIGSALRRAVPTGADLVALQEVEHAGAVRRLVNLELSRQGYRHVAWLPDPHSANGPVVLSKLPVRRVGALWVEGPPEQRLRPILEV